MSKRLIYAEDAIDALMEILDRPNHAEFLYTDEICKALEDLPFTQPDEQCDNCHYKHIWMTQRMNGNGFFGHGGATG